MPRKKEPAPGSAAAVAGIPEEEQGFHSAVDATRFVQRLERADYQRVATGRRVPLEHAQYCVPDAMTVLYRAAGREDERRLRISASSVRLSSKAAPPAPAPSLETVRAQLRKSELRGDPLIVGALRDQPEAAGPNSPLPELKDPDGLETLRRLMTAARAELELEVVELQRDLEALERIERRLLP